MVLAAWIFVEVYTRRVNWPHSDMYRWMALVVIGGAAITPATLGKSGPGGPATP